MAPAARRDLTRDLVLPTVLFAALGAMTWAVRGSSGFGGVAGCTFAGLSWGVAWWFLSREPGVVQPRRYASGWTVLALTAGIGIAGSRGWAQWSTIFVGRLQVHTAEGVWVPIAPWYGFAWMFVAGAAWAGLGACALAWCGYGRPTSFWQWALRLACGAGAGYLAVWLFETYPQWFMPLYSEMASEYERATKEINNNLWRITNDNREATRHFGWYLGFLLFEALRRDWRNVTLIGTVGLLNGAGWAALQNWTWAEARWPGAFNWWRCWESSGGISIGIAYGVAYFLVNRPRPVEEIAPPPTRLDDGRISVAWLATWLLFTLPPVGIAVAALVDRSFLPLGAMAPLGYYLFMAANVFALPLLLVASATGVGYYLRRRGAGTLPAGVAEDPGLARWAVLSTVALGLAVNLCNGLSGFANIYGGDKDLWSDRLWRVIGSAMVVTLVYLSWRLVRRPLPRGGRDAFPDESRIVWSVLIVQLGIGLLVTGPLTDGREAAFAAWYLALFGVTAAIVRRVGRRKREAPARG